MEVLGVVETVFGLSEIEITCWGYCTRWQKRYATLNWILYLIYVSKALEKDSPSYLPKKPHSTEEYMLLFSNVALKIFNYYLNAMAYASALVMLA